MIPATLNRRVATFVLIAATACGSGPDAPIASSVAPGASLAKGGGAPSTAVLTWFIPSAGQLAVRGDGLAPYTDVGGVTRYRDKECVYAATMFIGGSGDAVMQNAHPSYKPKICGTSYPREVTFTLYTADPVTGALSPSGVPGSNPASLIIVAVHGPGNVMPVGGPWELRDAGSNDGGRCGRLAFRPNLEDGTPVGADKLMVRRTAADTWEVLSQPNTVDGNGNVVRHDKAWCSSENVLFSAPVSYVIKSATALPTS